MNKFYVARSVFRFKPNFVYIVVDQHRRVMINVARAVLCLTERPKPHSTPSKKEIALAVTCTHVHMMDRFITNDVVISVCGGTMQRQDLDRSRADTTPEALTSFHRFQRSLKLRHLGMRDIATPSHTLTTLTTWEALAPPPCQTPFS